MIRHVLAGGEFSVSDIRADVEAVERPIWAGWPQKSTILILAVVTLVPGCAARSRTPPTSALDVREGLASYYGPGFDGKTTASGVRFDMQAMVAAHPSYAFGTVVRVTNLTNQRTVDVRVLDRGPARGPQADGVLIDLSYGAAQALGFIRQGRTRVRLEVLRWGN